MNWRARPRNISGKALIDGTPQTRPGLPGRPTGAEGECRLRRTCPCEVRQPRVDRRLLPELLLSVRHLDRLVHRLHGQFSAGDLMMVMVLRRLDGTGILDEYPSLSAYVARGEARPAYQRAYEAQRAVFMAASTG